MMVLVTKSLEGQDVDETEDVATRIHAYLEDSFQHQPPPSYRQTWRALENGMEAGAIPHLTSSELDVLSTYWHRCIQLQSDEGDEALLMRLLTEWFGSSASEFFDLGTLEEDERDEMVRDFSHALTDQMLASRA